MPDTMRKYLSILLLLLVIGSLVSCSSPTPAPTAGTTPGASPAPSSTPALTVNPTAFGNVTASPEAPPAASPTPAPTEDLCMTTGGRVETYELESELLPKPMPFRVYLPPCYGRDIHAAYPVLYLIHGQSFNDDQWDRLGAPAGADALIAAGEAAPFIIVMPRDRELSTAPDTNFFAEAVAQELVPWVDEQFRTIPDREHRAVGGLSRGGGWALHIAFTYPELFGSFGGHSMAIFWMDSRAIPRWLDDIPPDLMPRIYLDMGDRDYNHLISSGEWFTQQLLQRGIPYEYHRYIGRHEESYWSSHVEDYLRWYTAEW